MSYLESLKVIQVQQDLDIKNLQERQKQLNDLITKLETDPDSLLLILTLKELNLL